MLPLLLLLAAPLLSSSSAFQESDISFPSEPLKWGDVNFVHTTDTHGWLLGHQHDTWPEPNYSGDIGDLASFLQHMRAKADREGRDLLLIDSGDHNDGPGLVTSSSEGADVSDYLLSELKYDVLAIGNHEMYKEDVVDRVWKRAQEGRWNGRFITSNTNITLEDSTSVAIGEKYVKFITKQGRKVTAFGILYGAFTANTANTNIQTPADMIKEPWFLEAIQDAPDFFILAGHMPVTGRDADFSLVFEAIRNIHPYVPIFIFGGHSHIRDCVQFDSRSMALQSGRFCETLGWMSANLTTKIKSQGLDISRKYLDNNRRTYKYHAGVDKKFDTSLGHSLRSIVQDVVVQQNLSVPIGIAPRDYFMSRSMPGAPDSLFTMLMETVLPAVLSDEKADKGRNRLFLANSGCQRFDIFEGVFTLNDMLVVSPFTSPFEYFEVKAGVARHILTQMNDNGATQSLPHEAEDNEASFGTWSRTQREIWMAFEQAEAMVGPHGAQQVLQASRKLTTGYVTHDSCPGIPDDTKHIPVRHAKGAIPDYVGSTLPEDVDDNEIVLVVVMDFFTNDVVRAAKQLDPTTTIRESDAKPYSSPLRIDDVWGLYAKKYWQ